MGINTKTLWEWCNTYPPICNAIKKGREVVDYMVENALVKRALGYEWDEKTIEVSEKDGTREKTVTRNVPPDTAALIFYLKNRLPAKWRDKPVEETASTHDTSQLMAEIRARMQGGGQP